MIEKPKIQYVGQFYVHGSEARQIAVKKERKKVNKTTLPEVRTRQVQVVSLDPVAIVAMAVAVVMLTVMMLGVLQLYNDWEQYRTASDYVASLQTRNAKLSKEYREGYDLRAIRDQALGLGMVPVEEAQGMTLRVTVPERAPERTWADDALRFWNGLWEE